MKYSENEFMKLNLQFFAEETAGEGQEIGEPDSADEVDTDGAEVIEGEGNPELPEGDTPEEPEVPEQQDVNKIAADARRRAEEEAKRKNQAIDAEVAKRFSGFTNPLTNKPITSMKDYLDALDAQEEINRKNELVAKGIDPSLIDMAVANNPLIKQAQQVVQEAQERERQRQIDEHVKEVIKLDPDVKSLADITAQDTFPQVMQLVNTGLDLVTAYKAVNFERLRSKTTAAATQAAINQAKGKSHLNPANDVTTPDNSVDIPANELKSWQIAYPDISMAELKKKYNNSL